MTKQIQEELERIISVLRDTYKPEQIILYGSSVNRTSRTDSDIDLVVVKKTSQRFYDRIGDVLRLVRPREALDVIVYTPDEYARLTQDSWFVGEEVARKGKVVYAVS